MIAVMLSSSPSHSANGSQVVESSNMTAHPLAIIVGTFAVLALVQTIVCVETCEETRRIATSSHSDLSGGRVRVNDWTIDRRVHSLIGALQ
ncbi:hypothetical protein PAST3_10577 [Cutibacterium acnes HL201PA1]|nr:hypothetical protein PAST3_10577 [Cutibacterium acnes HL201PA1]